MSAQVIVRQAGPLPITIGFNPPGDGPMCLEVNGSVYSKSANTMIGIAVQLNQTFLGTAQIYSNGALTHRAVVTSYFPVVIPQGENFLTLSFSTTTTTSDSNDFFTVVLHY